MEVRKIRGSLVNAYLSFMKKKWGQQGMDEAMEHAGLADAPKNADWVELETAYALLDWVADTYGEEYVMEVGRNVPKHMAGDLKFMFASVIGFERLIKRARKEFSILILKGEGASVDVGNKEATIHLRDFRINDRSCLVWKGMLLGLMEITRTPGQVEILESDSEDDCRFRATWT